MNKIIRTGVFETNSSSCHSIAIAGEDKQFVFDSISPNSNGEIVLCGGEYGWEWFKTNDALEKANYAAQQLGNDKNLIQVIKEQTGADTVSLSVEDGYVDHQSTGIVSTNKEWLRNFIFNKNSWLFGGNDNSDEEDYYYDVPEWRDGKVLPPKYNYAFRVEDYSEKYFYKNLPEDKWELARAANKIAKTVRSTKGTFEFDHVDIEAGLIKYKRQGLFYKAQDIAKRNSNEEHIPYNEIAEIEAQLKKDPDNIEELKFWIEREN